jgi:class 3 adenylate cyclase
MPPPIHMAVLFADVSGSTRLYETVGDELAWQHIGECLGLLRSIAADSGGRVIKTIGDELMCVLPDADSAALAAAEMQEKIEQRPAVGGVKLRLRVGFQYGPVLQETADVFGDTVNVAAYMVGFAKGGQIMTTGRSVAALSASLRGNTRPIDALAVKGKQEVIDVHELLWQKSGDPTMLSERLQAAGAAGSLRLIHGGREIRLDASRTSASLGRDPQNTLVIGDRMASRVHARIERRRGKFVLVDQSTNGTYITVRGDTELQLRYEEFILRGRGIICFGHSAQAGPAEIVEFVCE